MNFKCYGLGIDARFDLNLQLKKPGMAIPPAFRLTHFFANSESPALAPLPGKSLEPSCSAVKRALPFRPSGCMQVRQETFEAT
jgi:hypothetical protein